jgi:hypothetical protein
MYASSLRQNRVWGGGYFASHLLAGVLIGPNQKKFVKGNVHCGTQSSHVCKSMNSFSNFFTYVSRGPWAKKKNGYLGLKFYIHGKIHFGWARLHRVKLGPDWVLTGYAYETIARKPIVTGQKQESGKNTSLAQVNPTALGATFPQPATLGMLASGSSALLAWRRKEPLPLMSK